MSAEPSSWCGDAATVVIENSLSATVAVWRSFLKNLLLSYHYWLEAQLQW